MIINRTHIFYFIYNLDYERILYSFIFFLLLTNFTFPQDKPIPPPRSFDTLETSNATDKTLPAITLPEFVIMGTEHVSFSSQKDLLKIYNTDKFTERSGVGSRETSHANYSTTPLRSLIEPLDGSVSDAIIKGGFGRFTSPYLEGWYAKKFSFGDISVHGLYERNGEYQKYPGFNRFGFDVNGGSYIHSEAEPFFARSRVQGYFSYNYNHYPFNALSFYRQENADNSYWRWKRSANLMNYGGEIFSRNNKLLDYQGSMFAERTIVDNSDEESSLHDYSHSVQENIFGLQFLASKNWMEYHFAGKVFATVYNARIGSAIYTIQAPYFVSSSISAQKLFWDKLNASVVLTAYLYRGNYEQSQFKLFPTVLIDYYFSGNASAFFHLEPEVKRSSVRSLLLLNPFNMYSGFLHQENRMRIQAGMRYDDKATFSIQSQIEYLRAYNYPQFVWFTVINDFDYHPALNHAYYGGQTEILSVNISASKRITEFDEVDGFITLHSSKNTEANKSVTYLPNSVMKAMYKRTFTFPLTVQAQLLIVGERSTALFSSQRDLSSYVGFGIDAEYRLMKQLTVFLRATNLFDQHYEDWIGYDGRPLFMLAGFSITL